MRSEESTKNSKGGAGPGAWLEIRDVDGRMSRVDLKGEPVLIGRANEAQVHLNHGMVSRKHASITPLPGGEYVLRDLSSRNGTFVNGVLASERVLAHGDRISIGPFTIVHCAPAQARLASTARLIVGEGAATRVETLREASETHVGAGHLLLLGEFFDRLLATADGHDRRTELCRLMTGEKFRARWAAVLQVPLEDEQDPTLVAESFKSGERPISPTVSRSVLRAVRQKQEPVIASNVPSEADVSLSLPATVMPLATIACPLEKQEQQVEILYASFPPEYATGEWLALASMASRQFQQAQSAWAARRQAEAHAVMERDLARARQIQMRLVPTDPQVPGLDLAIGFAPCRGVGGDYIDVIPLPDGKVFVAVADVCGKGLPAALVASSVRTMVHASLLGHMGLCPMMDNLNFYLRTTVAEENFVTMVALVLDPKTGEIGYVNAGHPLPIVVSPSGNCRELADGNNLPLRIETDSAYCAEDKLRPGEMLVLYTDGLTEIPIDEECTLLGPDGLASQLARLYTSSENSAREVAASLTRWLNRLQASPDAGDDRTFLMLRQPGRAAV